MRNRKLRSVLVAAFSAVVALVALSGFFDAKGDVRANTWWPVVVVTTDPGSTDGAPSVTDGAGS